LAARRRGSASSCIVPVDGFFEWKAIKGQKAKQPYAIVMKDGASFGLPAYGRIGKTQSRANGFGPSQSTTDANELVDEIHDRMPVTTSRYDYSRWLGEEPDPRDLMRPFPLGVMWMWPISTGVNKPENDNPQSLSRSNSASMM
jgi:putative SOS response-associated peptidase YedK